MQLFQNCLVTLLDSSSCCCFVTEARSYLRIFLLSSFVSGYSGNRTSDFVNQHVSPWSPSVRHLVIILRTYAAPGNPLDLAIYLLLYTRNVTTMFRVPFELVLIAYGRLTQLLAQCLLLPHVRLSNAIVNEVPSKPVDVKRPVLLVLSNLAMTPMLCNIHGFRNSGLYTTLLRC